MGDIIDAKVWIGSELEWKLLYAPHKFEYDIYIVITKTGQRVMTKCRF